MKANNWLLIAALFLLGPFRLAAVSCGDLLGQVVNLDNGKPVPFAKITFENYYDKVSVTANKYGYYYGDHLPEGRYQMRVSYNQRTFVMNHVKVYDGYSNEVNFFVSASDTLPTFVKEITPDPLIKIFQRDDIVLTGNGMGGGTIPLGDLLMQQPGIDIYNGHLYVKGAEVKFFIDGTPVLAPWKFGK
jgi:hypothetical protein